MLTVFATLKPLPDGSMSTRHIRAALPYADEVVVQDLAPRPDARPREGPVEMMVLDETARADLQPAHAAGVVRYLPGPAFDETATLRTATIVHQNPQLRAGLVALLAEFVFLESWVPLFANARDAAATAAATRDAGSVDRAELALAATLLAQLPAFPQADFDVILDVRERLADARTRFRSLMAAAATRFTDIPAAHFEAEVARFRREEVDAALVDIGSELGRIGAVSTLARVATDRSTLPATAALGVAAATLSPHAVLAAFV